MCIIEQRIISLWGASVESCGPTKPRVQVGRCEEQRGGLAAARPTITSHPQHITYLIPKSWPLDVKNDCLKTISKCQKKIPKEKEHFL
jgi:hypothetical protein